LISIVISTWNCRRQIQACLESLEKQDYRDFETIIFDQGSRDGTLQYLLETRDRFNLNLMWTEDKTDWTEANRIGMERAKGNWIAFSNPDIVFTYGSLRRLAQWADTVGYAVLGCNLGGHPMRKLDLASIFHVSSHRTLGTFLDRKIWGRRFEKRFIIETDGFRGVARVEHLQMSFFMVRKAIVGNVLWDKRFRWACADSDLLRRAKEKGLEQLYNHDIKLLHEGEYSRKSSPKPEYEYEYAYGYTIYAKNWLHVSALRFLFVLDALAAPFLLRFAKQDSFKNQIVCSAAKMRGLLA
jgi:GT2 family glycosyltransferase